MLEIIFQNQYITLKTFNLFLIIGFLSSIYFLMRYINLKKLSFSFLSHHFFQLLLIPLIGGRLAHVIQQFDFYANNPLSIFTIWDGALDQFFLFYTFLITLYILTYINKKDFWAWLDAFLLSGLVGLFFLDIGHFFNGSFYGNLTQLPWGVIFDTINIPFVKPIHPTQIYSALSTFVIFAFLVKYAKRTHLTGIISNLGLVLYSLSQFGIDFFHALPSTYAKINFIIISLFGFIFYIHCSHRKILSQKILN